MYIKIYFLTLMILLTQTSFSSEDNLFDDLLKDEGFRKSLALQDYCFDLFPKDWMKRQNCINVNITPEIKETDKKIEQLYQKMVNKNESSKTAESGSKVTVESVEVYSAEEWEELQKKEK